jgi:hypothetical protein
MNTNQLKIANDSWGWSIDITLINGKIYVANCGFITDNANDITAKKHYGCLDGFYYQYTNKRYRGELINVLRAIHRGHPENPREVTA